MAAILCKVCFVEPCKAMAKCCEGCCECLGSCCDYFAICIGSCCKGFESCCWWLYCLDCLWRTLFVCGLCVCGIEATACAKRNYSVTSIECVVWLWAWIEGTHLKGWFTNPKTLSKPSFSSEIVFFLILYFLKPCRLSCSRNTNKTLEPPTITIHKCAAEIPTK